MKKNKKQEDKKIKMPENEEELAKLITELSNEKRTRVSFHGFTMKLVNNEFLNILIYLGMNLLLMTASYCIFRPIHADNLWFLFAFISLFTFFDYLFKYIIFKYLQKLILFTASLIFIVEDFISLGIAAVPIIFLFEISLNNTWLLIGSLVVFLLVRFILVFLLRRKRV